MRTYADEIDSRAAQLDTAGGEAAREWATWIRQHAERTDPINEPLSWIDVKSCSHEELQPRMTDVEHVRAPSAAGVAAPTRGRPVPETGQRRQHGIRGTGERHLAIHAEAPIATRIKATRHGVA